MIVAICAVSIWQHQPMTPIIIRPPDIVVSGLVLPRILLSFFFRRPISELAERNSTKIGPHILGSKCNLKTHVQNLGYPLLLQMGAQKPPFWTTSQLKGNLDGLYLRNETCYRQSGRCFDNFRVLLHRLKTTWALVHKRLQTGPPPFLPTLRQFCILFHC